VVETVFQILRILIILYTFANPAKPMLLYFLLILFVSGNSNGLTQTAPGGIYKTSDGYVRFMSDAPLESIEAYSKELKGVIDTASGTFAFSIGINSFLGFNSPLQREHFNENYLESDRYRNATFTGKIIETINYRKPGKYEVRAKGVLNIHGIKQERIIKSVIEVKKEGTLNVTSQFSVSINDHGIKIPRIVYQKISPEIMVYIDAVFVPAPI
jgi:hypothetical protein